VKGGDWGGDSVAVRGRQGNLYRYVTTAESKRNEEEQTLQQEKLRYKLRYNDDGRGRYERPGRH
jgi:hypothetical protein